VTPTRYPTWRSLAFAIGILQLVGVATFTVRSDFRMPHLDSVEDRGALFFTALTLGGAGLMIRRPALGFSIFGAGWLVGAIVFLILSSRSPEMLLPVSILTTLGILYSVLGVKEMGGAR
jgi:hypothetical protein